MEKYTGKIMPTIMHMLIHSSFCLIARMWSGYRQNFVEVARRLIRPEVLGYRYMT